MEKSKKYSELDPELVLESIARQLRARRVYLGTMERTPVTTLEEERLRTWVWLKFFQESELTNRILASSSEDIGEDFEVRLRDLTELGLELYRAGYQRWLRALDRRSPEAAQTFLESADVSILQRSLHKLTSASADRNSGKSKCKT